MQIFSCLLFLFSVFAWSVLAGFVHHFATMHPDAQHTIAVQEHGETFYLKPVLGRLYVNALWIWVSSLAATLLLSWLSSKRPWRCM